MRETGTPPVAATTTAVPRREAARGESADSAGGHAPHRAGVTTYQGTAGNAAVAHWIQRQETPGSDANAEARKNAVDPTGHGEWSTFRDMMAEAGFPNSVTDAAWQLVLGGLAEQGQLNDEAMSRFTERQAQRDHRASNTWYQELVQLIGDYLEIDRPTMALWSGGIDTSVYARSKGHTPLEATPFGGIIDKMRLTKDWKLKTPMWNVLSKAFVDRARGPVHIFLRAYNPDSVLIAQEVPQLRLVMALHPAVKLIWHPLYTASDGRLMEVTKSLDLVPDASYATRDECVQVLYDYLRLRHDPENAHSERANQEMSDRLAANGNPR